MLYSFDICNDRTLGLVLSGSQLYSVENDNKKYQADLDDKERFVFEFLINNSSTKKPVSLKDIDLAYSGEERSEHEIESWQVTIQRLKAKYKRLTEAHENCVCEKLLIAEVDSKGYYIDLNYRLNSRINYSAGFCLSDFKPSLLSMLSSFLSTYSMALLNKSLRSLFFVTVITTLLYSLHVYHLSSIVENYRTSINNVAQDLTRLGCHDDDTLAAFNQSMYLDSALLITPFDSCFVDRDSVEILNTDHVSALLDLPQFTYRVKDNHQTHTTMIGRISLRSLESMYHNNLWSILIDGVTIQHPDENTITIGQPAGIPVHTIALDSGTKIVFYAKNLIIEVIGLFVIFSLGLYWRRVARFLRFCQDWRSLNYKLEKVVDTKNNQIIYHEILTRVSNRTALQYIENLTKNQLVTFHTVLIAKTIANAHRKGFGGVYGINICPGSLVRSDFTVLEKHLARLQANQIVLELTENSNLPYDDEIYTNINKLKYSGFKIALDDFGTGNNNVEIVQKVALDYLKIDKEFIRDIDSSEVKQRLLGTLSQIGEMSECQIIQEGVETVAQQQMLQSLGYTVHQGYLYA